MSDDTTQTADTTTTTADSASTTADTKAATTDTTTVKADATTKSDAGDKAAAQADTTAKAAATTTTQAPDTKVDVIDYSGLKLGEGYKVDDPVFQDAVSILGELKVPLEGAQKLIDFTMKRDAEMVKAVNDANAAAWDKQVKGWKEATTKEFSSEALGGAQSAAKQVFDADGLKYIEGLGLLNHPSFVRAMVKIHQAIKPDTWVNGNAATAPRDARSHFPKSNMNP